MHPKAVFRKLKTQHSLFREIWILVDNVLLLAYYKYVSNHVSLPTRSMDRWVKHTQHCPPGKNEGVHWCDTYYKSVSSSRRLPHPGMGDLFLCLYINEDPQKRAERFTLPVIHPTGDHGSKGHGEQAFSLQGNAPRIPGPESPDPGSGPTLLRRDKRRKFTHTTFHPLLPEMPWGSQTVLLFPSG